MSVTWQLVPLPLACSRYRCQLTAEQLCAAASGTPAHRSESGILGRVAAPWHTDVIVALHELLHLQQQRTLW